MNVPLLDLKLQYQTIQSEAEAAFARIAAAQTLILGQETIALEQTLAAYCDCKYAIGVSSGTDALLMALMALDIQPGDEVILPTYSFFATAGTVARLHAKPVFVDSEALSYNINPTLLEAAITPRTKAIIPVHLFGQCADMDAIMTIAARHNIPVIEDAAQVIGAQYHDGRKAGCMGRISCFSFYPTKNLGAFGDAGLVTTNDESLYIKLRQMRNHGMEPRYYHKFIGGNFRIDELQSAMLNIKFPHLESWHESRRRNANHYSELFMQSGLAQGEGITDFDDNNRVLLPAAVYRSSGVGNYHIYNQYVIRVQQRDALRTFLSEKGIGTEIYYPVPFHRQECFQYLGTQDADYPVANECARTSLALPIFSELRPEQIEYVVAMIAQFHQQ